MKKSTKTGSLVGLSTLSAIAASLCCISPILALLSGVTGIVSSFSWIEPVRSYLISFSILVLGFAWYQKLKAPTKLDLQCACEEDENPPFMQTKKFLGLVTVFAFLLMAFPYYGNVFYPETNKGVVAFTSDNLKEVNFKVSGMTCSGCEEEIKHTVKELPGIVRVLANSEKGITNVKYDKTKIDKLAIIKTIDATGYKVSREITKGNPVNRESGHVCGTDGCR